VRKILKFLFESNPVLALVRLILKLNSKISNFISHLKLKALIKNVGSRTSCHWTVEIKYGENIQIGHHSAIGPYSCLGAKSQIKIGSYVRVSRGVIIETAGLDLSHPAPYPHISKKITIEDGVWIASNAIILGGVTIGEKSIIGAGAVVTKNVLPNSILVGQPMRTINKK
jgi:maltose O-acetyltransferase